MIGRVFILTILCTSVLSLPVTSGQLENEDVKVMKCIVEALADVLSRPHPMPVSQDCLLTLKTDDRLFAILRHHNFLKELQEIAFQGGQTRAQEDAPAQETKTQIGDDIPDRSMLEALGGPGEQSILSQRKRMGSEGEGLEEAKEVHEKQGGAEEDQAKSHVSVEDWSEIEKRDKDEEKKEKREHKDKKGSEHNEKRDSTINKSKEEEREKKSALHSQKQDDKKSDEVKRGRLKLWSKRAKTSQKTAEKETHEEEEVPHHSKEVMGEEEERKSSVVQRSPEEKELQMIARTTPEEKSGSEEEGSGNRKETDIESLDTIESELESVAQKLHDLSEADRKRG